MALSGKGVLIAVGVVLGLGVLGKLGQLGNEASLTGKDYRDHFLATGTDDSVRGAEGQSREAGRPIPAGVDIRQLCHCSIARYMQGKSEDDLRRFNETNARDPEMRSDMLECGREMGLSRQPA